jgi:hypothetical protein
MFGSDIFGSWKALTWHKPGYQKVEATVNPVRIRQNEATELEERNAGTKYW